MTDNIQYSPTEQALLDLLNADKSDGLDIRQLTMLVYQNKLRPFHAETVVRAAMASLIYKNRLNREDFTVQRTKRVGKQTALFRLIRSNRNKGLKSLEK